MHAAEPYAFSKAIGCRSASSSLSSPRSKLLSLGLTQRTIEKPAPSARVRVFGGWSLSKGFKERPKLRIRERR